MFPYYYLSIDLPGSVSWLAHNAQRWAIIQTALPAIFVITTSPTHTRRIAKIASMLVQCIQGWPSNNPALIQFHSQWLSLRPHHGDLLADMLYPPPPLVWQETKLWSAPTLLVSNLKVLVMHLSVNTIIFYNHIYWHSFIEKPVFYH